MEIPLLMGSMILIPLNDSSCFTVVTLVISSVGVGLSICAFALLILTAALFAEWRQNQKNQLIIQLMLARMFYMLVRFLLDFEKIIRYCEPKCVIELDMLMLLYTECTLVAWMCRFSKHLNDSLVKVFNVSKYKMWEVSFCTWIIPGIISCLLCIAYSLQIDKEYYIFFLYIFLLKWPVLAVNAYLLITALKAVLNTNKSTENNGRIIVVMIGLIFVFSFQQVFVDICKMINYFIFSKHQMNTFTVLNILAIYQCAFSITFWVFGNSKTRNLWSGKKPNMASPNNSSFRISLGELLMEGQLLNGWESKDNSFNYVYTKADTYIFVSVTSKLI